MLYIVRKVIKFWKYFCDTKGKQIIYANLHGNQQSYIIYANMQIKSEFLGSDKFSQDVLQIFLGNVCINRKVIL